MYLAILKIGRADYKADDIAQINPNDLNDELISHCVFETVGVFRDYQHYHPSASPDTIGKSREFVEALLRNFSIERIGVAPLHKLIKF